ncbi:primosomal protein N' [Paenalcaligenes hominis]|uniref:primosomal protein N' n=1 Tax=Paenalcaligenes hominis TaxID=643674 RepID=UPI003524810D
MTARYWLRVALDVPLPDLFDYYHTEPVAVGLRVLVRFGRRQLVGMVIETPQQPSFDADRVKNIEQVLADLPPMPASWLAMAQFAARYYQRPLGEVVLPVLPAPLRRPAAYTGKNAAGGPVARLLARQKKKITSAKKVTPQPAPELNTEQQVVVDRVTQSQHPARFLLYGVTGSGKTETYLRLALNVLAQGKQVLFMVPEINLTPQFEKTLRQRLVDVDGVSYPIAVMHSGLADGKRLASWLAASQGDARVLLGTRMAVFCPLPDLGLIIVDEEHDASYKQQDGLRYSARDLAVWRAQQLGIHVILGSATPSFESWRHAEQGHYQLLQLTKRATAVALPSVRLIDTRRAQLDQGWSPQLLDALQHTLDQGQQSLIFLNRRGYAPVLHCGSCGWLSQCPHCSAYAVLHKGYKHYMQCHHCGTQQPVVRHCPDCGQVDLKPVGQGTQRIEEFLSNRFPNARIVRIDADATRRKGSAERLFAQVHAGEVDIIIGTQMVSKGHDFSQLALVGILNADTMLFAQDFRAPERLFAQLMQVAGRAGRHHEGAEVLVQTDYPDQAVYQALIKHDYALFAHHELQQRQAVGLPPYVHLALITAEAKTLDQALGFLKHAKQWAQHPDMPGAEHVFLYDAVPLRIVRVANIERAQLLIESQKRSALQAFLWAWGAQLDELAKHFRCKFTLEVDPQEI